MHVVILNTQGIIYTEDQVSILELSAIRPQYVAYFHADLRICVTETERHMYRVHINYSASHITPRLCTSKIE
jgi:hypothetical protein